jgi:hypothetical protein
VRAFARRLVDRLADRLAHAVAARQRVDEKTAPIVKVAAKNLYMSYQRRAHNGETLPSIWETGFRVFSQFDEDGIIVFLLGVIGIGPAKFVDIGGGDGVWASNCANLALNFGFHGLFIDADEGNIERGRQFYATHGDTGFFPPRFEHAFVTRDNINAIITKAGFEGEIDLLSIDIDGNDYWIWDAIECINPRIVLIETHLEFGMNSIVVPYDENHRWRSGMHPHYLGASPVAMTKLAQRRGYRVVGANRFGFNVFYVRNDLGTGRLSAIDVHELFRHDRNNERIKLFDEIKDFKYEIV